MLTMLSELIGLAQAYWPLIAVALMLLALAALAWVIAALSGEPEDYTPTYTHSTPHSTRDEDEFRSATPLRVRLERD